MIIYYSQEDYNSFKKYYSTKASIATLTTTRYLLEQSKTLKKHRDSLHDHFVLTLEFYYPIKDTEFIVGGLATHNHKPLLLNHGPIWFEKKWINHDDQMSYSTLIDNPIILQLLKDKTKISFFAFPHSRLDNTDILFSLDLSKQII